VAIALLGVVEWGVFLRRLGGQELGQVLTTMGIALIFQDLGLVVWGGEPHTIRIPAVLSGSYQIGPLFFPIYRLFIIAVALVVGIVLWVVLERTRLGAMIRATVDDAEMARGVGIHVPLISMGVFALGACLAAVVGGGMESLKGAALGSLLVGLLDNFGKAFFPELAYFTLFAPMAVILAVRPTGLFGRT
jgi:branched-chain amino acid transport system permease protein